MPDILCLSHLRWNFVFQRPQHVLSRFGRRRRVVYVEEAVVAPGSPGSYTADAVAPGVTVCVPEIGAASSTPAGEAQLRAVIEQIAAERLDGPYVLWYYTPAMLPFARSLAPVAVVYDCMDELSHFAGADPHLPRLETELLRRADVVFTGGRSLYESKCDRHPRVLELPSSVDAAHFATVRTAAEAPEQAALPRPRAGFYGVVDERFDPELLGGTAALLPDRQFVVVGPVVKIDPRTLPRAPNITYVPSVGYERLPEFLAGWDVALLPFARNDATRYISPTKTLEYLAARTPVVSTAIRDVVEPYGDAGLVAIADGPKAFAAAIERESRRAADPVWQRAVDAVLDATSWERTWQRMDDALAAVTPETARRL